MVVLRIVIVFALFAGPAFADVGLICTLKGEQDHILNHLSVKNKVVMAKREYYQGRLYDVNVVLVRSPMGKVNNAVTAQILASYFPIDAVISIGFAGAVDESVKRGDVVVSTHAVQHDVGTVKPYGFIWEKSPEIGESMEIESKRWATAKGYAYGTIASGDQFIASEQKRAWLKKKFNALAVDTGSAAIYEVCKQNNIPCMFIRVASDNADMEGRINFNKSVRTGDYETVSILREFLAHQYDGRR
jgi:adenosylhomocysteine nucleosidase